MKFLKIATVNVLALTVAIVYYVWIKTLGGYFITLAIRWEFRQTNSIRSLFWVVTGL